MGMRIFVTEGENFLEIIDENQRVSAGIGSNGEVFNNSAVEPQPVEPERFWLDFAEVLHVIIYGQSLSIGQYGTPVLNTPTRNALMFNTGVRSYSSSPASLVPLRETVSGSNGRRWRHLWRMALLITSVIWPVATCCLMLAVLGDYG
jgi:hypothetical protein